MTKDLEYSTYLSPFTWRYGSEQIRLIWSETNKRRIWRQLWIALAEVQAEYGLVSTAQVDDLRSHAEQIDIARAHEIEAEIHHDVMAEIKTYAEQCPVGGEIIHLGLTSMDIVDNTDAIRSRQSLDLLIRQLSSMLILLTDRIDRWADTPVMGFTHLQPAEPTTLGYRFAFYAQDLFADWQHLTRIRATWKGKGMRGAVGTGASFVELLGEDRLDRFEARLSELLGLPFFPVTTQVYPRKQDYELLSSLAGLGASLCKMAFDIRFLQSPPIGEVSEPFSENQVGSSAMPFKRNPIRSEKVESLARLLAQLPRIAWDNAAHSLLERTLDDSANRRSTLPEAFLIADELLQVSEKIIDGLQVHEAAVARNVSIYGPPAATERVLLNLVKAGADRQLVHERLRQLALAAWHATQSGDANSLVKMISADKHFLHFLPAGRLRSLMDAADHIGDAPRRARKLARSIREAITENTPPLETNENPSTQPPLEPML